MQFRGRIFASALLALAMSCSGTIDSDEKTDINGDGPIEGTPGTEVVSPYLQQMVAMQFTSVGCVNCPVLSTSIKNIQKNMPGVIIPVSFHLDYDVADPMTLSINKKFYEKVDLIKDGSPGLPMFALNFRQSSKHIVSEYAKIQSEIEYQAANYPVTCGVAIETSYDASRKSISVNARFKSDVAAPYRYHIFVLEDGIQYGQAGDETGTYVHDNVLRAIAGDDVRGTRLNSGNALEVNKEYTVQKTMAVSDTWNVAKLRVLVAMLKEDSSTEWGSYNANVCAVGSSVDYLVLM